MKYEGGIQCRHKHLLPSRSIGLGYVQVKVSLPEMLMDSCLHFQPSFLGSMVRRGCKKVKCSVIYNISILHIK